MPFYKIFCRTCQTQTRKLLSLEQKKAFAESCDQCHLPLSMAFGDIQDRSIETVDEYRQKKAVVGVDKMVAERADQYYKKVELPKTIAEKGIGYAVEHHLVDPNDL